MTENEIIINIKAETAKALKQIDSLTKQVKTMQGQVTKSSSDVDALTKSFNSLGGTLKGLAAAFVSFEGAKNFVTTLSDLEQGMIGVAKTTGATGEELDALSDGLDTLASELSGITITELQNIAETAGQLGITGKENILAFSDAVGKIAVATDLTADQAAEAMAQLSNVLGEPITNTEKLGSVINELSNTTTATASDVVAFAQRVAGAGKSFGLSSDQIFGLSATLKDVGASAELGGSAISRVMGMMTSDVEGFAAATGKSMAEFKDLITKDPIEALNLFLSKFGELDKFAQAELLKKLGIGGVETVSVIQKLAGAQVTLAQNLKTASDEYGRGTSLQKEYEIASQSLESSFSDVKDELLLLIKAIGVELLPVLKDSAEGLAEFIKSSREFYEANQALIETIGEVVVVLGSALVAWKALSGLTAGIVALQTAITGFRTASLALVAVNPVIAALVVALTGLTYVINSMEEANNKLNASADGLSESTRATAEVFDELYQKLSMTDGYKATQAEFDALILKSWDQVEAIDAQIEATQKVSDGSEEYANIITGLTDQKKNLIEAINGVVDNYVRVEESVKKSSDAQVEASEKEKQIVEDQKKRFEELKKSQLEYWQARLENVENVISKSIALERQLTDEISAAESARAAAMGQRTQNEINASNMIAGLYKKEVLTYSEQNKIKDEIARLGRLARQSISEGEYNDAQKYYTAAGKLIETYGSKKERFFNREISLSDEAARMLEKNRRAQSALSDLQIKSADRSISSKEKEIAKVNEERHALDALKSKVVELIGQIKNSKTEFSVDTKKAMDDVQKIYDETAKPLASTYDIDTSKADSMVSYLQDKASRPTRSYHSVNTSRADAAIARTQDEASQPTSSDYDMNTSEADAAIDNTTTKAEQPTSSDHNVNTAKADAAIARTQDEASQPTGSTHTVTPKTSAASKAIKELTKTTKSRHIVTPNTLEAERDIALLKRPTSSTHTVYVRTVKANSAGGLVGRYSSGGMVAPWLEHLSSGGFPRRRGWIPGRDTTGRDDVPSMLTRGEYVHKVAAVDYYGRDFMEAINQLRLPKVKGFAEGGQVDYYASYGGNLSGGALYASSGTYDMSSDLANMSKSIQDLSTCLCQNTSKTVDMNLNLDGGTFRVSADAEIAAALERYIRGRK